MQHEATSPSHALLIQLARLGDLVQSLPALEALCEIHPHISLDVLCADALAPLLASSQVIRRVVPWSGAQWRSWADQWAKDSPGTLRAMQTYFASVGEGTYDRVYPLNQHARSSLVAKLFLSRSGEERQEQRLEERRRPWMQYLGQIAQDRTMNRVHLADAWCGMCGVRPLGRTPALEAPTVDLPDDLAPIGQQKGLWVALVTGAGDAARCVPPAAWGQWMREFLAQADEGQVVLIGSGHEREAAQAIIDTVPTLLQGRVWDTTGRTTIPQLMNVLSKCSWVIGADTGPLHLGTLVGSRAVGFYFARARMHETGPYGEGHWVYQYGTQLQPDEWPIRESIALICRDQRRAAPGWTLWASHLDQWGSFFDNGSGHMSVAHDRTTVWRALSPTLCESVAV